MSWVSVEPGNEKATDEAQLALRWRYLSLRDPNGKVPPGALYQANLHRRDMLHRGVHGHFFATPQRISFSVLSIAPTGWTNRGPSNFGGRTRALLIHPTTPSTLYAGAVGGGVWKSTDSGATWSALNDFMPNLVISSMVFDPTTPATIYAATGEVLYGQIGDFNWLDGDTVAGLHGAGIFVSYDSGGTWTQLSNTASWPAVSKITISPSDHLRLLAATTDGIYLTTDGGSTWALKSSAAGGAETVAFDPNDGNRAVASVILFSPPSTWYHQLLYSSDAGVHWTASSTPSVSPDFNMRTEVAWAPSTGTPTTIYANVAVASGANRGEIWKSTDNGQTFSRVSGQGVTDCTFGHCAIWVSPTDATRLVVGGYGLARSSDSGATFASLGGGGGAGYLGTPDPHPDQHLIVADPTYSSTNPKVYVCNDGGIFHTNNILTAATAGYPSYNSGDWTDLNASYRTAEFYAAAGNAAAGIYTGGTQDNGSIAVTTSSAAGDYFLGGDGGWVAIDYFTPSIVYGEYTSLRVARSTSATTQGSAGYIFNLDASHPLSDANPDLNVNDYSLSNFIAPLVIDPLTPTTLLAGGHHLWRSTNAASAAPSWTSIRDPLISDPNNPGNSNVSAIAVWRFNSDIIWVAQNDGRIQKTANGTATTPTWSTITGPVSGRYITRIYIDPADSNVVYLAYGGYHTNNFWKSTNGGTNWTQLTGSGLSSLPAAPVRSIARHPRDSRMLFVSTDVGVFESDDGGATWIVPTEGSEGPAETAVDEVQFVEGSETLLAGTYGRGLFTYDLSSVPSFFPTGLNASATSTTTVNVSWNTYTGASSYQLFRSSGGGAYTQVGGTITTNSFSDSGLTAGTTYLYKVKAVVGSGTTDFSAPDLATTVTFTNDNDLFGRPVSATYLAEIRNAVNDVLGAAGLSAQTFSGGTSGSLINHDDIAGLRTLLVQAYRRIGMPSAPSFPSGSVTTGTLIKATHTQEIRNATK